MNDLTEVKEGLSLTKKELIEAENMFQKLELLLSKPLSSATPSCSFSDDIQPLAKEDLERITFTTDELLKPFDPLNVALDLELEKDEEEELMKVEEQEQEDEKAVDEVGCPFLHLSLPLFFLNVLGFWPRSSKPKKANPHVTTRCRIAVFMKRGYVR